MISLKRPPFRLNLNLKTLFSPGRTPEEKAEIAARKAEEAAERARVKAIMKDALAYRRAIQETLDRHGFEHEAKARGDKPGPVSHVRFLSDPVISEGTIYWKVDGRRLPRKIDFAKLADENLLQLLSNACERPVAAIMDDDKFGAGGFAYEIQREVGAGGVPSFVDLAQMWAARPAHLANAGHSFPIGVASGGVQVWYDMRKQPGLLIGGAQGSGKTAFIHALICTLAKHNSPNMVRFVFIDLKMGVGLGTYARNGLPHLLQLTKPLKPHKGKKAKVTAEDMEIIGNMAATLGEESPEMAEMASHLLTQMDVAEEDDEDEDGVPDSTRLTTGMVDRREFVPPMLRYLIREIENRFRKMAAADCEDVGEWNKKHPTDRMPYIYVIADEFAEFFFDAQIGRLAELYTISLVNRGRAAGCFVVLATQTVNSEVVTARIRIAMNARLIGKISSPQLALSLVGNKVPSSIPPGRQGRMVFSKTGGGHGATTVQTPFITSNAVRNLVKALAGGGEAPALTETGLTAQDIFEYALEELGGRCSADELWRVKYSEMKISKDKVQKLLKPYLGQVVTIRGEPYKFMPGSNLPNPMPARLLPVKQGDAPANAGNASMGDAPEKTN